MEKRIIFTGFILSLIFSSLLIYSSYAQNINLPICVAPTRYLIWNSFKPNYVPIASYSSGILTSSPIYVFNNSVGIGTTTPQAKLEVSGAIRFTPQTSTPTPAYEGMMYYNQNEGAFYCYMKDNAGLLGWLPCGGNVIIEQDIQRRLIAPVQILDANRTKLVLEITEE